MKVPIEFVGHDSKFAFDITDIYVPAAPIPRGTANYDEPIIKSFKIRVDAATADLKVVEDFILTKIGELTEMKVSEQDLDNSELIKMLEVLQKVVNQLAELRLLLTHAINSYITLSANISSKNSEIGMAEKKADRIRDKLNIELDNLRSMTETVYSSRAYYKSLNVALLEFVNDDVTLQIDKILQTLIAMNNTIISLRTRSDYVAVALNDIEGLLYVYECWAQQLKSTAYKLLEMYKSLFQRSQDIWLRLISGSYLRMGDNFRINRNCATLTVSAFLPPMTDCDPPQFLDRPPPEIDMPESQKQECPPCITTTTTTTTTSAPDCEILFTDFNDNKALDDDLDLYINGKLAATFVGSTDAKSTYKLRVPSGAVKVELRFKKSNNNNTLKEIQAEYVSTGAKIFYEQVWCYSKTAVGTTIWTKNMTVTCPTALMAWGEPSWEAVGGAMAGLEFHQNNVLTDALGTSSSPIKFKIFIGCYHKETRRFEYAFTYTDDYTKSPLGGERLAADRKLVEEWVEHNPDYVAYETDDWEIVAAIWQSRNGNTFFFQDKT